VENLGTIKSFIGVGEQGMMTLIIVSLYPNTTVKLRARRKILVKRGVPLYEVRLNNFN
jgi:hypothetical protein